MLTNTRPTKHPETLLSLTILGILVAIGLIVFAVQNRFNPAVDNFTAIMDKAADRSTGVSENDPGISAPQGIQPMSPEERFDSKTLSDKINGKAELYLSTGFVELITQRFRGKDDASAWFEVFVYNMGTPSGAFAVFSTQRRRGADTLELTRNAYATANAVFFTTNHFYVELIGATAGPEVLSLLTDFAEHYVAQNKVNNEVQEETLDPQQFFPGQGLIPDSLVLIGQDAFGFDRFDQVYTARYDGAEEETTLFVSKRSAPAEADHLAGAYRDFLIQFGGSLVDVSTDSIGEKAMVLDILDAFEVIFSKGPYLAGVHMAENKEVALQLALQLDRHLDSIADRKPIKE